MRSPARPDSRIANAFYADREKRFPPRPWTDALRDEYLERGQRTVAHNRTLLPERFNNLPKYKVEVVREPSFSEVAGGAAHAAGPARRTRPGRVYVHLLGTTEVGRRLRPHVPRGHPRPRHAGRHPGAADGHAEPALLLLDEPMAALDVAVAPALRQLLRKVLRDTGRTALLVTHDLIDAMSLSDRVVVLEAGRIVEDGPPARY